jgi:hypothetical protein
MKHLTYVERRWLEWGFLGADVGDPWGDRAEGRWAVSDDETTESLAKELLHREIEAEPSSTARF